MEIFSLIFYFISYSFFVVYKHSLLLKKIFYKNKICKFTCYKILKKLLNILILSEFKELYFLFVFFEFSSLNFSDDIELSDFFSFSLDFSLFVDIFRLSVVKFLLFTDNVSSLDFSLLVS